MGGAISIELLTEEVLDELWMFHDVERGNNLMK
jgi:hypothetical protein